MSLSYNTSDNTAQNNFINPPQPGDINEYQDNNVYVIGSTIDLSWQTNYSSIQILLWQNGNSTVQELPQTDLTQVSSGFAAWDVNLNGLFSLNQGNVFFFWIINALQASEADPAHFSSHYFNISDPSSTTSVATKTPDATSKTSPPATPSAAQNKATSIGNTEGTKLGVGIGVGVGVFLLLLLLGAAFWIRRKRRSRSRSQPSDGTAIVGEPSTGGYAELSDWKNQPRGMKEGVSELTTEGNEYKELPGYPSAPHELSTST